MVALASWEWCVDMLRAKVRGLARFASRKSEQAEEVGFASGEVDAGAFAFLGAALDVASTNRFWLCSYSTRQVSRHRI